MAREQKKYDDDDGRVIASMEGLSQPGLFRRGPVEPGKERPGLRERFAIHLHPEGEQLTPSEARRYTWAAVLAGLTIVGVFAGTWVVLVLILTTIW